MLLYRCLRPTPLVTFRHRVQGFPTFCRFRFHQENERLLSMDDSVVREAEKQMKRPAPEDCRPAKKARAGAEEASEPVPVGRFQYSAAGSLEDGFTGFLLTCQFYKEKSAIKEARVALQPYLAEYYADAPGGQSGENAGDLQVSNKEKAAQVEAEVQNSREKTELASGDSDIRGAAHRTAESAAEFSAAETFKSAQPNPWQAESLAQENGSQDMPGSKDTSTTQTQPSESNRKAEESTYSRDLMTVKVAGGGVSLLKLAGHQSVPGRATSLVARLHEDLQSRKIKPMQYCQRILPVEAVSLMEFDELKSAAAGLIQRLEDIDHGSEELQFAVGYRSRQVDKSSKDPTKALAKAEVIKALAAGFSEAVAEKRKVKVNLSTPQVVLLCEALRVGERTMCALGLLPVSLVTLKPKVSVKTVVRV